jgi:hypothetical protein
MRPQLIPQGRMMTLTVVFGVMLAITSTANAEQLNLTKIDCGALQKQTDGGSYLVLRTTSIRDSRDNTYHFSAGQRVSAKDIYFADIKKSMLDLIDEKCGSI